MKEVKKNIDEYILSQPSDIQEILQKIRSTICKAAPKATEKISYGMPCFWQGENLVYFAAAKTHIGFYPTSEGVSAFADELAKYNPTKGTIRFPLNKEIPYDLITKITKHRVKQAEMKIAMKG